MTGDFEFHVNGLENAILDFLKKGDSEAGIPAMSGVKEFATYSGELDRENLIDALKRTTSRFPLVMVAYGSGADKRKTATGLLENEPIEIEHSCGFIVVVASQDFRGETKRRKSVYSMIAEARTLLGGIQFEIAVQGETEKVLLNHSPLIPSGVECISRMNDLTAYAVHFDTMFREWLPDRRVVAAPVEEITMNIYTALPDEN